MNHQMNIFADNSSKEKDIFKKTLLKDSSGERDLKGLKVLMRKNANQIELMKKLEKQDLQEQAKFEQKCANRQIFDDLSGEKSQKKVKKSNDEV